MYDKVYRHFVQKDQKDVQSVNPASLPNQQLRSLYTSIGTYVLKDDIFQN